MSFKKDQRATLYFTMSDISILHKFASSTKYQIASIPFKNLKGTFILNQISSIQVSSVWENENLDMFSCQQGLSPITRLSQVQLVFLHSTETAQKMENGKPQSIYLSAASWHVFITSENRRKTLFRWILYAITNELRFDEIQLKPSMHMYSTLIAKIFLHPVYCKVVANN